METKWTKNNVKSNNFCLFFFVSFSVGFIARKEENSNSKFKIAFNVGWMRCGKLATEFNA